MRAVKEQCTAASYLIGNPNVKAIQLMRDYSISGTASKRLVKIASHPQSSSLLRAIVDGKITVSTAWRAAEVTKLSDAEIAECLCSADPNRAAQAKMYTLDPVGSRIAYSLRPLVERKTTKQAYVYAPQTVSRTDDTIGSLAEEYGIPVNKLVSWYWDGVRFRDGTVERLADVSPTEIRVERGRLKSLIVKMALEHS